MKTKMLRKKIVYHCSEILTAGCYMAAGVAFYLSMLWVFVGMFTMATYFYAMSAWLAKELNIVPFWHRWVK